MQAVTPAQMAGLKKRCDDLNIFILTPDSADYPQRLRDLPDLPLVLYGTGTLPARTGGGMWVWWAPAAPQSMGFPPAGIFR